MVYKKTLGIPYEGYRAKETKHLGYLPIGELLQGVAIHIIFYVNGAPCCTAQHPVAVKQ